MGLNILTPGLLTTVQDGGRWGYQKEGVIVSGAMDSVALRIGNILLGNKENEAALEITLKGPEIYFEADLLIALTGADLSPNINGKAVKMWRPTLVKNGSTLSFGRPLLGCRAYLAVAGGFDVPEVLGSSSTYLRAGLGGWKGRALKAGDLIPAKGKGATSASLLRSIGISPGEGNFVQAKWTPSPYLYPAYNHSPTIRALPGPEYKWFSRESRGTFWSSEFQLTPQSDRMGARLKGPAIAPKEKKELLSTAVTFGTVQLPPDGNPIILMADRATTGGYPRLAQIASADLAVLAQLPPGKTVKFKKVSLQEAGQLLIQQEQYINVIKRALQLKI